MPHVQREQPQPLKSSPSTRISCLSMEPAFACRDQYSDCDG
jgi:hypothetical protein